MKTIINLLVLIILFFIVFAGYQIFFEEKDLKDIGKIFSSQSKKLQAKGAEKVLDIWIKENVSSLKYKDIKCFKDEKYGLSCTIERPRLEINTQLLYSNSITVYGISELGLKGFGVTSYLNTAIKVEAKELNLPLNYFKMVDHDMGIFPNIAFYDTDHVSFELNNAEPSTGTIEFKSHVKFESKSSKNNREINIALDTYGAKDLVKNIKSLNRFMEKINKLNLDVLSIKLEEGESKELNKLLYHLLKGKGSYRDMINSESSESTAYYTLMASLAKDIHKDAAKKIANFISYRSSKLELEISSISYDDVKLESFMSDFESGKLSSNKNIEMK